MNIEFAEEVDKEIKRIKQKNQQLAKRVEKQIALFQQNPKHPSLRTHKLSGSVQEIWSISITMSIRMVYLLIDENTALFVKIGTHDEVYGK